MSSEYDKTLYDGGFFRIQAGPFLDTGKITDPSGVFGDPRWLVDTGVQVKLHVLGAVSVFALLRSRPEKRPGHFFLALRVRNVKRARTELEIVL